MIHSRGPRSCGLGGPDSGGPKGYGPRGPDSGGPKFDGPGEANSGLKFGGPGRPNYAGHESNGPGGLNSSGVVRHLSGEARRLVLNLPPNEQTTDRAFEELRAEYSDMQTSLDPLADFYERYQRPGESSCSYANALEATLHLVEEAQLAPMKPRLLSFCELQAEFGNLAQESKKFQTQPKTKKTYAQVQFTTTSGNQSVENLRTEKVNRQYSELTELTDLNAVTVKSEKQLILLQDLLRRNADVFSKHSMDYGHTTTVQHEIPLVDPKPFHLPYGKIPSSQVYPNNLISSPGDGTLRICVGYRKFNSCSTRDAFPLPRIEDALEALGQARFFSTLDLTSGYWQIEVAEHDKHKTAFSTPMGLY
ncbi:hypothetical protein QQF64_027034 [Cirrhinus molitorella]|uniref:ribonuclease H n=1 Tax=Cirrhinus molitorella TaxID=172907 RepID=A0ABR3NBB7_9TELE